MFKVWDDWGKGLKKIQGSAVFKIQCDTGGMGASLKNFLFLTTTKNFCSFVCLLLCITNSKRNKCTINVYTNIQWDDGLAHFCYLEHCCWGLEGGILTDFLSTLSSWDQKWLSRGCSRSPEAQVQATERRFDRRTFPLASARAKQITLAEKSCLGKKSLCRMVSPLYWPRVYI